MNTYLKRIEKVGIFFIAYSLIFLIFFGTLKFTIPFILALLFAFILKAPTRFLVKKLKVNGWLASLITTSIFFILIATTTTLLVIALISETIDITKYLQNLLSNYSSDLSSYLDFSKLSLNKFPFEIDPEILELLRLNLKNSFNAILSGTLNISKSILQYLLKFLSYIPYVVIASVCTVLSTYFFTKNLSKNNNTKLLNKLSFGNASKVKSILIQTQKMFFNYIMSYIFIIFLSMSFTFIGFSLFRVEYSLTLSILAGLLDLLPIVGMAIIYIPLALIYFINGNNFIAVAILILYVLILIFRQVIEPKIMSSSLGINPIASIAALFIGMQLGGFIGIIFCLFLVVSYTLFKKVEIL